MTPAELLIPVGSPEAVYAAVLNGANAVYMGMPQFNARRNAKNLTGEQLSQAVEFCHLYGVKVYITLNTCVNDRELSQVSQLIKYINQLSVDAVIVQDLGVLELVRQLAPQLDIHASTQMSVHSLEGVLQAAKLGVKRVVLARELSVAQLEYICKNSPIETEVFVHGALCMSYSGQCYMSAVIGQRSANRGMCAQPCRLDYNVLNSQQKNPLSLKDLSLLEYIRKLSQIGVSSFKIEGRMKRAEYVAVVAGIYRKAIDGTKISPDDVEQLRQVFSRQGFTSGYYEQRLGSEMFGTRQTEDAAELEKIYEKARDTYRPGATRQIIGVDMYCLVKAGQKSALAVVDRDDNKALVYGPVPQQAINREVTREEIEKNLLKTGGTPFVVNNINISLDGGMQISAAEINSLRRQALESISEKRRYPRKLQAGNEKPLTPIANSMYDPAYTVSVLKAGQITKELAAMPFNLFYIPLEEYVKNPQILAHVNPVRVCVSLPRIINDDQAGHIEDLLERAKKTGITKAICGNIGHIEIIRRAGMQPRGDFGFNVLNQNSLYVSKQMGLAAQTLSFELTMAQIRDISKCIDTEIIVYGALELMIFKNCIVKNALGGCQCDEPVIMTDRRGETFELLGNPDHTNLLLNGHKLFLAHKKRDYQRLGLWAARLAFTTETPEECLEVARSYLDDTGYTPEKYTTGLYYRGVL